MLWDKVTKLEDYLDVFPDDLGWTERLEEAERNAKNNSHIGRHRPHALQEMETHTETNHPGTQATPQ